jgi:methylthioribose-1-phosphate isomerase
VEIIDQTKLPHDVHIARLCSVEDAATAIATMQVRGAPLIGVTAAYGMALALRADASDQSLAAADALLRSTRPTAVVTPAPLVTGLITERGVCAASAAGLKRLFSEASALR